MSVIKINSFDISNYKDTDVFFLDTNILYYIHSGYYSQTTTEYIEYSNLVQQIIMNHNKVYITSLNVQELLNGIENKEYQIYLSNHGLNKRTFTKKDYRNDFSLRAHVKAKLYVVLSEIKSIYSIVDCAITLVHCEQFVNGYESHHYDPIDYFFVQNSCNYNSVTYISADKDFLYDQTIDVITK